MPIRIERRDGNVERMVVAGCLGSRSIIAEIAPQWEPHLLPSRWASMIVNWCIDHYKRYGSAPGRSIVNYVDQWASTQSDREIVFAVEHALNNIWTEWETIKRDVSPDYVIDCAARLFNQHKLRALRDQLNVDLESGDVDGAMARVHDYRRVELGLGSGINLLEQVELMHGAFEQRSESLVTYPSALGTFFGPAFGRDCFVAFLGKEKIGKSYWLQDIAWRGMEQNRNVAYFEVGDMSQHQVLRRFATRALQRPLRKSRYYYPMTMEPVGPGNTEIPEMTRSTREEYDDISPQLAIDEFTRLAATHGANRFKLSCHPNSTISVAGIDNMLTEWERDGWTADLCVIDYADILAPMDRREIGRDAINNTWKAMRALSQRRHCCVVTATQADADSYDSWLLSMSNFSEDKRKYAHVTAMAGINQTQPEKERGIYRLNWLVGREFEFTESQVVWTAACLTVGNPAILSVF